MYLRDNQSGKVLLVYLNLNQLREPETILNKTSVSLQFQDPESLAAR